MNPTAATAEPDAGRIPLSRDRVAAAAVQVLDADGAKGLTMRSLGAALGVEAMALYNHVENKDDLLAAATDRLYAEVIDEFGEPSDETFGDGTRRLAVAFRDVVDRHPGAGQLLVDRPSNGEASIAFLQLAYRVFGQVTPDPDAAALAFSAAASMVTGLLRHEELVLNELTELPVPPGELPEGLAEVVQMRSACLSHSSEQRFEFALEVLIAGLEHVLGAE